MDSSDVIVNFRAIANTFGDILTPESISVIEEASSLVLRSSQNFQRMSSRASGYAWGYTVFPENPITFLPAEDRKFGHQVDMFLDIQWDTAIAGLPMKSDIALRVWTNDPDIAYRPDYDSSSLSDLERRVIMRLHFDRASGTQDGPTFHTQVGGNTHEGENCWFHEGLHVPRLVHYPLDIVLAFEMVAANFFPDQYEVARKEPAWRSAVKRSQSSLLLEYFQQCVQHLTATDFPEGEPSLLKLLWND